MFTCCSRLLNCNETCHGEDAGDDDNGGSGRIRGTSAVERVNERAELMTVERVAALHRVSMFSAVPGHALVSVARVLDEVRLEAGDAVIARGAIEDWFFVIVDGQVRVHVDDRTICALGPGEVVGEFAVLAPAPRSSDVTASQPTLLLRLRRGPFEELLEDQPALARAVISNLARLLQGTANASTALS